MNKDLTDVGTNVLPSSIERETRPLHRDDTRFRLKTLARERSYLSLEHKVRQPESSLPSLVMQPRQVTQSRPHKVKRMSPTEVNLLQQYQNKNLIFARQLISKPRPTNVNLMPQMSTRSQKRVLYSVTDTEYQDPPATSDSVDLFIH